MPTKRVSLTKRLLKQAWKKPLTLGVLWTTCTGFLPRGVILKVNRTTVKMYLPTKHVPVLWYNLYAEENKELKNENETMKTLSAELEDTHSCQMTEALENLHALSERHNTELASVKHEAQLKCMF